MLNKEIVMQYYGVVWAVLGAFAVAGCGVDDIPPGSSIRFDPVNIEWTVAPNYTTDTDDDGTPDADCVMSPDLYSDSYVAVTVLDNFGIPLTDVDLTLSLDLAANTFSGYPPLGLYQDVNGNGVIDGPEELVSNTDDGVYTTSTDSESGDAYVLVRVNLSCPFGGNLNAFAGSGANGAMNISVSGS